MLQRPGRDAYGQPQFNPPRSVITKFTAADAVQWVRERKINTVTDPQPNQYGGYDVHFYETFYDSQTPVEISNYEGQSAVRVTSVVVDPQNNVFVGFDEYYVIPPPNASYVGSKINLIVKFDANGNFLWRRSTTTESDSGMADTSELRKLQVAPDGGVVGLINNHQSNNQRLQQTVLVKFAADGTKVTFNHYGLGNDGSIQFRSELLTVTEDGNGNIFLLTNEEPDPYNNPTPDQVFNVIRKFDPSGNVITRKDVPVYPGYTAGSTNYPTDGWIDAAADASGNLYVAGSHFRARTGGSNSTDEGESNQLVLKFDPSLTQLWRVLGPQPKRVFSDENQALSGAKVLRLSATGVTVAGDVTNSGIAANEYSDFWETARYALDDGHLVWHRLYQAPATDPNQGFTDTLAAMEVDSAGNVYASGSVSVATGGSAFALIKWSDRGDLQFVKLIPNEYGGIQPATLSLPAATNRPTFFGRDLNDSKTVLAIDVDNPAVVAAVGSLANISTRVHVGGNGDVLIGGFIVTGPAGGTKKVLIRAIGPSLTTAGVSGALPDTVVELHDSAGHVIINDDWQAGGTIDGQPYPSDEARIEATGVAPTSSLESALIATVPTGNTTAIVRGKDGASGVGLVEVYDLDSGTASPVQLANISTRGFVDTGENVMIGGIIVAAPNPALLLVRAIGPSLAAAGVPNALQDPYLELRDVNGNIVVANDNWRGDPGKPSQQNEIAATGVAPSDDRESALIHDVDPGNYTAIVRGTDGVRPASTGVGLVEVYRLP